MASKQETTASTAIIAIGTSAGGLQALEAVLGALPRSLPVPVVVVQHLDPSHESRLTDILCRHSGLDVRQAEDRGRLRPGVVYVAPPDHHLRVQGDGTLHLDQAEPVRFSRPSIDLLLESVASAYGPRSVAVVLTGAGSDGAAGVEVVSRRGGTVIVQDPETAEFSAMPTAAVGTGCADRVLPLDELGQALLELTESV